MWIGQTEKPPSAVPSMFPFFFFFSSPHLDCCSCEVHQMAEQVCLRRRFKTTANLSAGCGAFEVGLFGGDVFCIKARRRKVSSLTLKTAASCLPLSPSLLTFCMCLPRLPSLVPAGLRSVLLQSVLSDFRHLRNSFSPKTSCLTHIFSSHLPLHPSPPLLG